MRELSSLAHEAYITDIYVVRDVDAVCGVSGGMPTPTVLVETLCLLVI